MVKSVGDVQGVEKHTCLHRFILRLITGEMSQELKMRSMGFHIHFSAFVFLGSHLVDD